ncbi:MAG: YceI family protein [Pseudomonadota bacterium]
MKTKFLLSLLLGLVMTLTASADDYVIDTEKAHAFIQFRIQHLGFSWVYGRFNRFEGSFEYDEKKPKKTKVAVTIDVTSIDTNHAERDKHLRSPDFFEMKKYPTAKFVSTGYKPMGKDKGKLMGKLTIRGITQPVTLNVTHVGAGNDPWGGYRRGFHGTTTITMADFGIPYNLGPSAREVELMLSIEGIRK